MVLGIKMSRKNRLDADKQENIDVLSRPYTVRHDIFFFLKKRKFDEKHVILCKMWEEQEEFFFKYFRISKYWFHVPTSTETDWPTKNILCSFCRIVSYRYTEFAGSVWITIFNYINFVVSCRVALYRIVFLQSVSRDFSRHF